jgi:hypothetical protein
VAVREILFSVMRHALAALGICGALMSGCGSSDDDSKTGPTASATEKGAANVALRYLRAVAAEDWQAACETRTQREREDLSRLGGSCERALAAAFEDKPVALFERARVGEVRIKRDKAGVDIVQPGQTEPSLTLVAVREGQRWRLEDVPDSQAP